MSVDLLQSIKTAFDDETLQSVSTILEVDSGEVLHDLPVVAAAVCAGLIKKSSSEAGIKTVGELLDREDALSNDDGDNHTDGDDPASVQFVGEGTKALDRIFGSGLDDLVGAVARYCKLPKYKLRELFGATGKICLSGLSDLRREHSFENEDIAAIVLSQSKSVSTALPDNLYAALGLRRSSRFASQLQAERITGIEKRLDKTGSSGVETLLLKRLLPVAVIVLVALIAWILLG